MPDDSLRRSLKRRALFKKSLLTTGQDVESGSMFRAEAPFSGKIDDLRHQERIERGDGLSGGVVFEQVPMSPWAVSLDGRQQTDENTVFGPSGLCPLCNNASHQELDAMLLHRLWSGDRFRDLPFTQKEIAEHVIRHIGPVYSEVGSSASPMAIAAAVQGEDGGKLGQKIAVNVRSGLRRLRFLAREDGKWETDDGYEVRFSDILEEPAETVSDLREIRARPPGVKGTDWYAFRGGEQMGELRKWGTERTELENVRRSDDAIIFYDEMLRSRRMAMAVYDDIMEGDAPTKRTKDGTLVESERNYGAAIASARLVKDIAMDLMKLALISAKMGDGSEKTRNLSPALQDMISDLGIFEDSTPGQEKQNG
jgi:hypothetical protein